MAKIITITEIHQCLKTVMDQTVDPQKRAQLAGDLAAVLCTYSGGDHSPGTEPDETLDACVAFHWDQKIAPDGMPFVAFDTDVSLEEWKAEEKTKPPEESKTSQVTFCRKAGQTIELLVVLEIEHDKELVGTSAILRALETGITQWTRCTEAGKKSYELSCGDYNIGDFLSESDDDLRTFLDKEGIYRIDSIYELVEEEEVSYDRILVSPADETDELN